MKVYFTFDYELFFGENSGSVLNSIIIPTQKLIEIAQKHNAKFTFFVDSGMLVKMQEYKTKFKTLKNDYDMIVEQIHYLDSLGHSIQLHIHPHWEDSYFNGEKWIFDLSRYRLHKFNDKEIDNIVYRYKKVLVDIVGDKVTTFRAGGWCLQPFDKLKDALYKNDIIIDSTVFYGGKNLSKTHYFDFTNSPQKEKWNFNDNPLIDVNNGKFIEVPISSIKVSPLFYWKFAFTKKFATSQHEIYGDGKPVGASKKDILKMLLKPTYACISCDGYKSSLLQKIYNNYKKNGKDNLVIIGHPKAQSEYSLNKIENFLHNRIRFLSL